MSAQQLGCIAVTLIGCAWGPLAHHVQAAVVTYTDRAAWLAAVGPLSGTEDFNSFAVDTSYRGVVVALNNMNVTGTTGVNGAGTQKIDVPLLEFSGFYDFDGTAQLLGDLNGVNEFIRIDFSAPVVSWGVETVGMADVPRTTNFNIYSASNVLLGSIPASSTPSGGNTKQFYGFDLTADPASYLTVQNTGPSNDVFAFDNIVFVQVPEPTGPLPAFGAWLALVIAARRRQTSCDNGSRQ